MSFDGLEWGLNFYTLKTSRHWNEYFFVGKHFIQLLTIKMENTAHSDGRKGKFCWFGILSSIIFNDDDDSSNFFAFKFNQKCFFYLPIIRFTYFTIITRSRRRTVNLRRTSHLNVLQSFFFSHWNLPRFHVEYFKNCCHIVYSIPWNFL